MEAWILHPTEDRKNWLIASWSGAHKDKDSHAFVWNKQGRVLAVIDPVGDSPYRLDDEYPRAWVTQTWIGSLVPPDPTHPELILLDYANWITGVLRAYELTQDSVTEVSRMYHAGHINDRFKFTTSLDGTKRQVWLTGAGANSAIRDVARTRGTSSNFLACFDFPWRGTYVFPPWTDIDPTFRIAGPEPYGPAEPEIYFAARCLAWINGRLEWQTVTAYEVDEFLHAGPGVMDILLSSTMTIQFRQSTPAHALHLDAMIADTECVTALSREALDLGLDPDEYIHHLVVDSMLTIAAARPGLEIVGPIRDLRPHLPTERVTFAPNP
ncbi:MAG: hypothetical protein R3E97_00060 [Candidatus Eisenbacteria bacterium]